MMFSLPEYEYQSQRISVHKGLISGSWNTLAEIEGPGIIKHLWITFPFREKHFGRKCKLRIFWEEEETPSVEAPVGDFFGVPFGLTGTEYQLDSCFLHVLPKNGMNCFFTMPFSRKAKIELYVDPETSSGGFFFQCDYEKCTNGLPKQWEKLRFHAKYRMESPTESYGHRYLAMDAEGEGYLIGAVFGIRVLQHMKDSWYHGGGDLITIDGELMPHLLHGIGGEDFFGHSWGTDRSSSLYMGNPFFQTVATDSKDFMNLVLYRFFAVDPIRFKSSITMMLGAMGASISSVVYWYQTEPHREFYKLPEGKQLYQESEVRRLSRDIQPEYVHSWNVFGPVKDEEPNGFEYEHEIEREPNLGLTHEYRVSKDDVMTVEWKKLDAPRGFMDFHVCMRPQVFTINYQTKCYGFALGYVNLTERFDGMLRIGFDDRIRLYVDDQVVLEAEHENGFDVKQVPVSLEAGRHTLLFKLSNEHNSNFKSWASHFAFADNSGNLRKDIVVSDRII